jgi:hypothetical protein
VRVGVQEREIDESVQQTSTHLVQGPLAHNRGPPTDLEGHAVLEVGRRQAKSGADEPLSVGAGQQALGRALQVAQHRRDADEREQELELHRQDHRWNDSARVVQPQQEQCMGVAEAPAMTRPLHETWESPRTGIKQTANLIE